MIRDRFANLPKGRGWGSRLWHCYGKMSSHNQQVRGEKGLADRNVSQQTRRPEENSKNEGKSRLPYKTRGPTHVPWAKEAVNYMAVTYNVESKVRAPRASSGAARLREKEQHGSSRASRLARPGRALGRRQ